MADKGETATYLCLITLSTETGELPSNDAVADIIAAQMTMDYLTEPAPEGIGLTTLGVCVEGTLPQDGHSAYCPCGEGIVTT